MNQFQFGEVKARELLQKSQPGPGAAASPGALKAENDMLRAALEQFPGGIVIYNGEMQMVFCSAGAREILELPDYLFDFGPPSLEQMFRFNATRGEYGPGDIETQVRERLALAAKREAHKYRRVRPNGNIVEVRGAPVSNGGFVTVYLEIDARSSQNEAVRNNANPQAIFDVAMHWSAFHEKATGLLKGAGISTVSALHLLDIDDYKGALAKYGETGAGVMMNALAQRIARALGPSELFVYLGGDEFAVLQFDVQRPSDVAKLGAKLAAASRQPVSLGSGSVSGALSIGVAMAPRDGRDLDSLLLRARNAMRRNRADTAAE